jgi:hypothetical protein
VSGQFHALVALFLGKIWTQSIQARRAPENVWRFWRGEKYLPLPGIETWTFRVIYLKIYEGKQIPLQVWRGPECSWRLGLPDFKTVGISRW